MMDGQRQTAEVVPARAKRPQPPGGSRKGIPNRATADLKAMILGALDKAGGVEYLTRCANDPKLGPAFLSLVGKVLPLSITGSGDGPLRVVIERRIVDPASTE